MSEPVGIPISGSQDLERASDELDLVRMKENGLDVRMPPRRRKTAQVKTKKAAAG